MGFKDKPNDQISNCLELLIEFKSMLLNDYGMPESGNSYFYDMEFSGKYIGTLWYGAGYPQNQRNSPLNFQMEIEEKGNWFTGTAMDLAGVGASPDEAKIEGIINGIHIEFNKVYKRLHWDDGNGNTIIEDGEGFPIYYEGTYNDDSSYYEGSWKYMGMRRFLFFFKRPASLGSGTFRLKKEEQ